MSADPFLVDELIRVCAAADLEPDIEADPVKAFGSWGSACVVFVGDDLGETFASMLAGGRMPRRGEVVLVSRGLADAPSVRLPAGALGASIVVVPAQAVQATEYLLAVLTKSAPEAPVLGVIGGCGGAGASTFAVALVAAVLRRRRSVVLLDVDRLGGGLAALLAMETAHRPWSAFVDAEGLVPGTAFASSRTKMRTTPTLVSWGMEPRIPLSPQAMSSVARSARRTFNVVVADLPRQWEVADLSVVEGMTILLVLPTEVAACAAAVQVAGQLRERCLDIRLVVRRTGRPALSPDRMGAALGLPVVASFRSESAVRDAWNRGEPPGRHPGALSRCADRIVDSLGLLR